MVCQGEVIYKGIEKRDGGIFKNDKGQDISYGDSYVVKFDEIKDGMGNERKVKFPASNKVLFDKFKNIEPYTKVELYCDVVISNSVCKLVPLDVAQSNK